MDNPTLKFFRTLPKSDLHNHCLLGGKRSVIEAYYGKKLDRFRSRGRGIADLNDWIEKVFRPFFYLPGAFEKAVEAAFVQALCDGVTRLEMSIDIYTDRFFGIPFPKIIDILKQAHQRIAPAISFSPELGMARAIPAGKLEESFEKVLEYGYFRSVDLYDDELAQPAKNFRKIYERAKKEGMICKAHAGEFGTAGSVRETVEVLHLDAVQHGIAAASSPEVMKWLAANRIIMNVCPASNIRLGIVKSYATHPIRRLFDHGIRVTVNTDDALVFGPGNSEQYLHLFRAGVFTLDELDQIRLNGLESPGF